MRAGSGAGTARRRSWRFLHCRIAVKGPMPAAQSSPIDPAIGQLLAVAPSLGQERAHLLPVLAAVPDPRARRGVRHRLSVILGLAACAVLAGARSFTAIGEWAADADQGTRDALGITGAVPCESTFRQTVQHLDADALDAAAAAGPSSAPSRRRVSAGRSPWTVRHCAGQARPMALAGTCWTRSITGTAWSWPRPMS